METKRKHHISHDPIHDSALKHVQGKSIYIDDMPEFHNELKACPATSPFAYAVIKNIDISEALKAPGVRCIVTADDIPGENQMGPVFHDEVCLADKELLCIGHTFAVVAADTFEQAYHATKLIKLEVEEKTPVLTIDQAKAANSRLQPQRKIERGDVDSVFANSKHVLQGQFKTGAQEHWYLETQSCIVVPGEELEMMVYSSTQHPSETQAIISKVLGIPRNEITVETRRLGGAFGGKETSGNHVAAWAALLARKSGRPIRIRLTRDMDQSITGKRHPFQSDWKIAFDDDGRIEAYQVELNANGGMATDLTMSILERGMLHAENSYFIPNIRIIGNAWKTNLPSNVAFRGFGQPQGMAVIEEAIESIAIYLGKDPLDIRRINYYDTKSRNITPYGAEIKQNHLLKIEDEILKSSDYLKRKAEIDAFNHNSKYIKRGISLIPVKFGISFTTSFLNQAGALIHIYADGSIQVNHGGIEMGQGLNTKMIQVAAAELGVNIDRIKLTPTNTSKVPNTSATAASTGSDLNGMAIKNAVAQLKERLLPVAAKILSEEFDTEVDAKNVIIENDNVFDQSNTKITLPFDAIAAKAYVYQTHLSAAGYYRTPDIYFDRAKGVGKPFHYYTYGMAVSEVEVDTLVGRVKLLRARIIEDAGETINEQLDIGQVMGGFVQGLGWVTTEDIKWNEKGKILNASPDTYKIPTINDIPVDIEVKLLQKAPNDNTIRRSKAVGEPPFPLALSVFYAIKYAIASLANHKLVPKLNIPATNEEIVLCVRDLEKRMK